MAQTGSTSMDVVGCGCFYGQSPELFFICQSGSSLLDSARSEADRKSTRLNSSHQIISSAVFCFQKRTKKNIRCTDCHEIRLVNQPCRPGRVSPVARNHRLVDRGQTAEPKLARDPYVIDCAVKRT